MNNEQIFKKGDLVSAWDKNEKKIYGVFIEYCNIPERVGAPFGWAWSWGKVAWQDGTTEEENLGDLLLEARAK